jgi:2-succinyl-5-enolpyruvyl-6-hydroxy-3-cyclohexene-1-carboxylate synthase
MLLSRLAGFRDGGVVGDDDAIPLTVPRATDPASGYAMSKYLARPLVADPWAAIEDYLTRNTYAPELPSASQQLTRTQIFVVGSDAEAERLKESIPGEVEIRRLAQDEIRRLRS